MEEERMEAKEACACQDSPVSEEELQAQRYMHLRRQANIQGGALMIYKLILNVAVFAFIFAATLVQVMTQVVSGAFGAASDLQNTVDQVTAIAMDFMGWGYLLAVAIGWLALRLWKKSDFFRQRIYQRGRPMTIGSFLALVCIVFGIQIPAQLWSMGLEWVCNRFGLSMVEVLESNSMDMDNLSIWLYVCLAAPISEEILFRGLILRSVEDYGKRFAILVSAVLFGLYHGSPIQTPYAILVGLVLGFVAVEYNVIWAMVLHMMNNLLLSDTLPRLLEGLPYQTGETIMWIFLGICALIGLIIAILRWRDVRAWKKQETIEPWQRKAFWRSPCIIILTVWCLIDLSMYFLLLFL